MFYFEGAKIIDAEELKESLDEASGNPTIERLMFIEAKAMNGDIKIFPCLIAGYSEEKTPNSTVEAERPELLFYIYIVQGLGNGEFGLIEVCVKESELGVSKRIWDRPASKGLRELMPWVDNMKGVS